MCYKILVIEQERPREQERRRFVIVEPANAFIQQAEIKAQRLDGIAVDEQIRILIASHPLNQRDKETQIGRTEYLVVETTKEQFLRLAEKELNSPNSNVRECFESLVVIAPEAETASDIIDRTTGIRIINIKKREFRFPTHPTPAS